MFREEVEKLEKIMNKTFRTNSWINSIQVLVFLFFAAAGLSLARAADNWEVPRTSSGHPVLQGYWTNSTVIPLQRPVELGEQAFYTREQAEALLRERLVITETEAGTQADVHYQFQDYALNRTADTTTPNLRTSIITEPANGRYPEVRPEALAKADEYNSYRREHQWDSAQNRGLSERCIVWGQEGPPMLPLGYNSTYQIVQTEDYVVVVLEMIHDARIIPIDGRDPAIDSFPQWLGNSRGHWEGDTLVVETTGFSGKTNARGVNAPISQNARVTERFTRTSDDLIQYEFTVSDPTVWNQSWSGTYPMMSIDGPMFEYACHEGNYGIVNILSGKRADEREAAKSALQ